MNQVKLVIWDLDETFWKGTLSEGPVEFIPENVEMVRTLVQRGIMCSISSKNDFELAKAELERAGIWDYFIFPVVNWNPKGENIKDIISRCQLRAVNVLFIDDNASNRKETEFYNPGLMTIDALDLPKLLEDEGLQGKDDSKLSRLKQYKILEQKEVFKTSCSDNTDFLIKSNIRIEYLRDIKANSARIAELIARSNQLNFTKIRIDESGVLALADNPNYECAAIHVVDNFGDYGICGFYALDKEHKKLEHFLFSCRILNLGVENFIYQQLGCPTLEIVPQVSETIDPTRKIDWIKVVTAEELEKPIEKRDVSGKRKRVLLMGGCDLDQLVQYIDASQYEVVTDFNYVNQLEVPVHRDSLCYIKAADSLSEEDKKIIHSLPFNDENLFDYNLNKGKFDVLIYSVLVNYTQVLYRHREKGFIVSYGRYDDITKKEIERGFTKETLAQFAKEYECIGQLTPEDYYKDLTYLLDKVKLPIIFLNGAEVDIEIPEEVGATERHKEMNAVLDRFVAEHSDRCQLLDVRKLVQQRDDCTNCIRHYKRIIYVHIAEEIMRLLSRRSQVAIGDKIHIQCQYIGERMAYWTRKIMRKCQKILGLR